MLLKKEFITYISQEKGTQHCKQGQRGASGCQNVDDSSAGKACVRECLLGLLQERQQGEWGKELRIDSTK